MKINEEKRAKFIESAGKRVNNVLHDMQILEPMARSSVYDFTKEDIEEMFTAMQETLDNVKAEFNKKFEEKAKSEKKVFSFGAKPVSPVAEVINEEVAPIVTASNVVESINEVENIESAIPQVSEELASVSSTEDNLIF